MSSLTVPSLPCAGGEEETAVGVTAARGFRASGIHCGIRRKKPDLALIVSERRAAAACVFTTNRCTAAPVEVSRAHLGASGGFARAIVVNAGNANAMTGDAGLDAAKRTAGAAASLLGIPAEEVLVASTGVIGVALPVDLLLGALPDAVGALASSGGAAAADAILTTDLRVKLAVRAVDTPRGRYTIGGMAKGSGMIHPNMATTLAFVTTDAGIAPEALQAALRSATDRSFNRITVDGDTSTNDMIAVLANGASGVTVSPSAGVELQAFTLALTAVLTELARMVVRDGEGATKLINVEVTGAASEDDALQVARTIASSPLVKTAVHGADANWGRIAAAAGRAGVAIQPERLRVRLSGLEVLGRGYRSEFSEADARALLERDEVTLAVDLGLGQAAATVWTCDLTPGYIAINASYRS